MDDDDDDDDEGPFRDSAKRVMRSMKHGPNMFRKSKPAHVKFMTWSIHYLSTSWMKSCAF